MVSVSKMLILCMLRRAVPKTSEIDGFSTRLRIELSARIVVSVRD